MCILISGLISIIWLSASVPARAAESLSELGDAQRAAIIQLCTPLQFTQGADAYRQCLLQNLAVKPRGDEQDDALSFDEQYAIQRACANTRSTSSTDYASCTRDQLDAMTQEPAPTLSAITIDEQYILAQQCFQTQTNSGARAYRKCINTALAPLGNLPAADFATRSNLERNNIQLECSISSGDVATYRKCLLNTLGIAFEQATTQPVVALQGTPATETESSLTKESPDLSVAIVEPEVPRSLPEAAETVIVDSDTVPPILPPTEPERTLQKIKITALELLGKVQSRLSELTRVHWIALLTTLGMALIFFIFRSVRKDNDKQRRVVVAGRPDLAPVSSHIAGMPADNRIVAMETFDDGLPAHPIDKQPSRYHVPAPQIPMEQPSLASNTSFADWLNNFQENQQQEYAIEFLIYWMAYADNRFDPTLKQRVFEMKNPDIPNLIKRWVFKKDANAFADAIGFLQAHANATQRRQIINLLMALLINENALTPAQNNLLRFFADAFGIGKTELNKQFDRAYGQPMPEVPRPDKIAWWDQITPEQKLRWDARAAAKQPDHIRCRIALGQPLKGELENEWVNKSFNLAMDRCTNERVDSLGEREISLLATQRKKFESARKTLLEAMT